MKFLEKNNISWARSGRYTQTQSMARRDVKSVLSWPGKGWSLPQKGIDKHCLHVRLTKPHDSHVKAKHVSNLTDLWFRCLNAVRRSLLFLKQL